MRPKLVDVSVVLGVAAIAGIFLYQNSHDAGSVALVATKTGTASSGSPQNASQELASRIDAVAATVPPGAARSNAMRAEAVRSLDQQQANAQTENEKQFLAANAFLGFYWINTKTRTQYCAEQGAPIAEFQADFASRWAKEYNQSLAVLKKNGAGSPDEIYKNYQDPFAKRIVMDMEDVERVTRVTTLPAACAELNKRRAALIQNLDFEKMSPQNYQALMQPLG